MAVELGAAYISVGLGTNTLGSDIKKAFGSAESSGSAAGGQAGKGFVSGFKGLVGAGAALLGAGMFAGFIKEAAVASDATDKFKSTMSFAGLDTSAIDAATKAAKAYADQTVFDLPTIQSTMAQLASNGIKDYTGLTQAAGNLNAVAGGSAETFKSVSMVMTQTAGAGKLSTENWNQLADAIPGAAGPLMKAMQDAGAYTGNFRDAMAAGQITSDEFNASLMKLGMDPVAVEAARSTKTFEGAIGNLQATINSGLMSALDAMKPAITGAINLLSNGLGKAFEWTGKAATGLFDLFAKGDFSTALSDAFNVSEDSGLVSFLFNVRDGFAATLQAGRDFWQGLTVGLDGVGASQSVFAQWGDSVFGFFNEAVGGVKAFVAAFKAGDGDVTSSGFAGFLEGLGGAARQVFDAIGPAVSTLIPQIVSLWSAFSPLQMIFAAIGPLIPQLVGAFGQLAGTVGGALGSALTALMPVLMELSSALVQGLGTAFAAIVPVAIQLIGMLGDTFTQLMPVLVPIVMTIVQLATSLISQLAPIITNLISSILPPLVNIFGNILTAIGPVITMIAGLLIPIIQALMPVVVTVFGVIANVIGSVMQIIQGIIQVVTGIISGNWSQVWEGIGNIFGGIWNTIVALVSGAIAIVGSVISNGLGLVFGFIGSILGSIGQFFADTWNNIVNAVSGAIGFVSVAISTGFSLWWGLVTSTLGNIGSFFADTWNNITSGVGGFIDGFLKFFLDLPGKIMAALAGAGEWLLGIGKNIIDGLINGITGMAGTVAKAILGLVPEAIRGPIEAALGIHSPSRVAMWWMEMIGEGFVKQMPAEERRIGAGMANLVAAPALPSIPLRTDEGSAPAGFFGGGSAGSRGPLVEQKIYPAPGMSEEAIGRVAADSLSHDLRRVS